MREHDQLLVLPSFLAEGQDQLVMMGDETPRHCRPLRLVTRHYITIPTWLHAHLCSHCRKNASLSGDGGVSMGQDYLPFTQPAVMMKLWGS